MRPNPSSEPRTGSDGTLGVRHQAGNVAGGVAHAGDRPHRAVGVGRVVRLARHGSIFADVPEEHLAVGLQRVERGRVGEVAALAVGDRHPERPARAGKVGERRVAVLDGDPDIPSEEPEASVPEERSRHEPGLGEHLEAVADPEDQAPLAGERGHGPHHGAEAGDDAGPDVVAEREAARAG